MLREENTESGQLQWQSVATINADKSELNLYLDQSLGLSDIDFHPVTETRWDKIKASGPKACATLAVSPEVKTAQLLTTLENIHKRGGYDSVVIFIRQP